jgi:hypothetical protein
MIKNTGANNAAADYDDLCFTGDFVHKYWPFLVVGGDATLSHAALYELIEFSSPLGCHGWVDVGGKHVVSELFGALVSLQSPRLVP